MLGSVNLYGSSNKQKIKTKNKMLIGMLSQKYHVSDKILIKILFIFIVSNDQKKN